MSVLSVINGNGMPFSPAAMISDSPDCKIITGYVSLRYIGPSTVS